jgi:hypothetical protein
MAITMEIYSNVNQKIPFKILLHFNPKEVLAEEAKIEFLKELVHYQIRIQ